MTKPRDTRLDEPMMLHVYGQRAWHDEVVIKGTIDAIITLRAALDDAIKLGSGTTPGGLLTVLFVNDGEGFEVRIEVLTEDEMLQADTPYTADYARGAR